MSGFISDKGPEIIHYQKTEWKNKLKIHQHQERYSQKTASALREGKIRPKSILVLPNRT